MKCYLLLPALVLLLCLHVNAQNKVVDSLKKELLKDLPDTSRISTLTKLAVKCANTDFENALSYGKQALQLAEELNSLEFKAKANSALGYLHRADHKYPEALYYYGEKLKIEESRQNNAGIAGGYENIGHTYYAMEDFSKAFSFYSKALAIYKKHNLEGIDGVYNNMAIIYYTQNKYDSAQLYYNEALKIAEALKDKESVYLYLTNLGNVFYSKGNTEKALEYYFRSLDAAPSEESKTSAYQNIGIMNEITGNYIKALEFYLKALKLHELVGNKEGLASSYSSIASIYRYRKQYDQCFYYLNKALVINEEIKDQSGISLIYYNMAAIYEDKKEYAKALDHYQRSLTIREAAGDQSAIASSLLGIGNVYLSLGKNDEAFKNLSRALEIDRRIGNMEGQAFVLGSIGNIYSQKGNYPAAIGHLEESLEYARQLDLKDLQADDYQSLAEAYEKQNNYKAAYQNHKKYSEMKNLILNTESSRQLTEIQTVYETEKKEKEIELLTTHKKVQKAELERQTLISYSLSAAGILVLLLALVALRGYHQKRKSNALLGEQKKEIEIKNSHLQSAYLLIEDKNKDITDSINYAKNIQQALLPFENRIAAHLKQYFILFKPRDIVSGDFYWFTEKDKYLFLAVADCTGHGVPGAFMSMIGSATLTHAISERGITDPGQILSEVNRKIKDALKQSESNNRDGMDISLLRFEKNDLGKVQYAGAMRNLYHISSEVNEVRGDKMPIGGATDDHYEYTSHALNVQKDETLYIFSDGYADQFGGNDGKKFRTGSFKKILLSIQDKPISEQKQFLDDTFETWKGNLEQVDDVCVVGVKI